MSKTIISGLAAMALMASIAQAAPVFEDNFNTTGALSSAKYSGLPVTSATLEFDAVADGASYFGAGNPGMLRAYDAGAAQVLVTTKLGQSLDACWVSLDVYDATTNASANDFFRLTLVGPSSAISFDDGKISVPGTAKNTGYVAGTAVPINIYYNSTSSAVSMNGVLVSANTLVVYNGTTEAVKSPNVFTAAVTNVQFSTNTTDTNADFYADNFAINNVPEPIGAGFALVAAMGLAMRRRAL